MTEKTTRAIIQKWLDSQDSEWHEHEPGVYHASTAWTCHRKKWYQIHEGDADLPLGLFHMAEEAERAVQSALEHHLGSHFVLNDIPVKHDEGDFAVVGRTDPVVVGYNFEPLRLYEVKSSQAGEYANTKPSHRHQAGFYAHKLGIDEVHIPHPNRNDILDMPEPDHQVPAHDIPQLFSESIDHFEQFHAYMEEGELPPANPKLDGECEYCDYKSRCQLDGGWVKVKAGNGREVWRLEGNVKKNDDILEVPGE